MKNKLLSYILKLWKNNKKVILTFSLFLLFCGILAFLSRSKLIEKFDMNSLTYSIPTSGISLSSGSIDAEYEYLAPIQPGTVWTDVTQNAFVDKMNIVNNLSGDKMMTKDKLAKDPLPGFNNLMEAASEKEAQYYIDNGFWPWDKYVTDFIKNDPELSKLTDSQKLQNFWPNRLAYGLVEKKTVPIWQFLTKVFSSSYNEADNNQFWKCSEGILQTKNGSDGEETPIAEYSFFEKNIKDFQFTNGSCNPCSIPSIKMESRGHSLIDVYNSPNNQCKFTVGKNPEAYNIFMGSQGLESNTTPVSDSASADYQQCLSQCDKYKT